MNEEELVKKLRREAAGAPPAPQGEWEAIAARTLEARSWLSRLRRPLLSLGAAAALASAAFVFIPGKNPGPETDQMEAYFSEAGLALGRAAEKALGEKFFLLADTID